MKNSSRNTRRRAPCEWMSPERLKFSHILLLVVIVWGCMIAYILHGYFQTLSKPQEEPVSAPVVQEPVHIPETLSEPIPEPEEPVPVFAGTYRVTAYCSCEKCCGKWALNRPGGIVYGASGEELVPGVSCSAPLDFGTKVEVEGQGTYVVQDRTAKWVVDEYGDKVIDLYFADHDQAKNFGVKYLAVYIYEGGTDQ